MTEEHDVMSRVSWKIGGDIGNADVLDYMTNNVEENETIVATVLGMGERTSIGALFGRAAGAALGGDYLLVTNRKVVVLRTGIGTWSTGSVGLKTKTFLYDHIASVDVSKRWISGEIEIVSAGMVEKGSGGWLAGAARDSVVQFEKEHYEEVQKLAAKIRELATLARQSGARGVPDIPDQLSKLAQLRDSGVLSEEEFTEQKRKLLSRL